MQQRVSEDQEPDTQGAMPLLLVLAVDGHGVLAAIGQQPRNCLVRLPIEPGIPNDRHLLVDEIFGAKVVIEAIQREADYIRRTDQPTQDAGKCTLAATGLAHEQKELLLAR